MAHRYFKNVLEKLKKQRQKLIVDKMEEQISVYKSFFYKCVDCHFITKLKVRMLMEKYLDDANPFTKPAVSLFEIIIECQSNESHDRVIFSRDDLTGEIVVAHQKEGDRWIIKPCRIKYLIDTKEMKIKEEKVDFK